MQQRPSYTSSSYVHMADLPLPYASPHFSTEAPVPSQDSQDIVHQYQAQLSYLDGHAAFQDPLDPWLFDTQSCSSPVSTTSSIHSEGALTPGSTATLPTYHMIEESVHLCQAPTTNYPVLSNNTETGWQPRYPDLGVWNAQSFALPQWTSCTYTGPSPLTHAGVPSNNPSPSSSFSYPSPTLQHVHTTAPKTEIYNEDLRDSSDDSDDESDVSDLDDSFLCEERGARSASNNCHPPGVQKLGKWTGLNSLITHETRHYSCNWSRTADAGPTCEQRFVRPEHLRRHLNTVHGGRRPFGCFIPDCNKRFSRGDNLRDHYWTHLERGGRRGTNAKFSFKELKALLGPKEKKLVRRLKEKLIKHRANKALASHQKARPEGRAEVRRTKFCAES